MCALAMMSHYFTNQHVAVTRQDLLQRARKGRKRKRLPASKHGGKQWTIISSPKKFYEEENILDMFVRPQGSDHMMMMMMMMNCLHENFTGHL